MNKITWYPVPFTYRLSAAEIKALKTGLKAQDMNQRWNVYEEDGAYIFERSWSNDPNFKIVLSDDNVCAAYTAIADPESNEAFYQNMLAELIALLGKGELS